MRRSIKIAALAAAGTLALTACSGGGGGGSGDGDLEARGDITIWYSNNEAEIEWGKQMVEAWNADHPDEQVKAQEIPAGDSSEAVISAAITAGNAPCLIFNTSPAAVPQFEKAGGLVSLSSFEDGDDYINERSGDNAAQYSSADGEFYQMPWKSNPVVIFYNKAMFTAAGLDPEAPALSTYDEFLDTARTLTESGAAPTPSTRRRRASSSSRGSTSIRSTARRPVARCSSKTARRPSIPRRARRCPNSGPRCTRKAFPARRRTTATRSSTATRP